jgi:hypothetical protein
MMKIHSIEVAVSSLETSEMILKSLDEKEKKNVEVCKKTKYPLLSDLNHYF